jgi:7-keto-8-aminopelargonate synthetase-like enzyme
LKEFDDKSSIKIDESQKDLNVLKELNHRSAHDDVYSARVHRYVVFAHNEFEIIDFLFEKETFLEIREKIIDSQTL